MLIKRLIRFKNLCDIYSGEALAKVVNNIIEKFNLIGRIISIITDNARSNDIMIGTINKYLEKAFENHCFLDRQVQLIPCFKSTP